MKNFIYEFLLFGLKEMRACIFAGSFFLLLIFSEPAAEFLQMARYDFLFLGALSIQILLVWTGVETKDELKVICVFHLIGLILEAYKTHPSIGSWSYPEEAFFKIGSVPLYSGFMHAAVASYIIQVWRILKLRVENYPSYWLSIPVCVLTYLNFFTNHFIMDIRWIMLGAMFVIFFRSRFYFTIWKKERSLSFILSFLLSGFFIWVAENIGTFWGAWEYNYQKDEWAVVDFGKITSWVLLFVISFIIVADLKIYKESKNQKKFYQ